MKMDLRKRRLLSFAVVCNYLFLGGSEYAVIFPTAWEFLQSLGVHEEYLLGITIAAYSLSASIFGVIGGRFSDKYPKSTKPLTVMCIVLMVIGNLLYMLGIGVWNIIIARFICGIGTGAGAALLGYVCRTTTVKERTSILAMCNASRQIGILIAPAFQFFLTLFDFQLGSFKVDRLNAAGLFMAVLWFLFIFVCLAVFENVNEEWHEVHIQSRSGSSFEEGPHHISLANPSNTALLSICESVKVSPTEDIYIPNCTQEVFSDLIVALMGTVFTIYFAEIVVETLIPYYMKEFFGYDDVPISFMYMVSGVECLLLLVALVFMSHLIYDWILHLTGLILIGIGYTILLYYVPLFTPGDSSKFVPFVVAFLIIGAGYPITSVANASLISKSLSTEAQGLGQGLRRLMSYLGLVIGPLWAGAAARQPMLLMGVTLALVLILLLLYLDVMPKFMKIERAARLLAESEEPREETPLLDPSRNQSPVLEEDWSSREYSVDRKMYHYSAPKVI